MGSPPFAFVSTVVTAISLSWVSSSVAAAPIVAATLVAFVRMPLLLVEAQLFSILLFIMFILVSCHDTVVSCFAVTISRHDFIVSRFAICFMWPSAPLASRADVGGTISTPLELPSLPPTYAKASPWVVCCRWKAAGLGARTYCLR